MPDFNDLTLLPLCVGLTLIGLIASWAAWRRRGLNAGIRGVAWSLLPVALYLTNLLELLWDVVKASVDWVTQLIFSPTVWAGIALFGVSVVLFVVSGFVKGRTAPKAATKDSPKAATGQLPQTASAQPARAPKASKPGKKAETSEEFDEIEDILKRHGIN
ncbi:hypothetical protein [Kribbella deserti]|uniref:Cellulose synthase n=1 Tax=Kribbella deserti TaxID=1926257 RepID=A0ABV6QQJ5_9ACTN